MKRIEMPEVTSSSRTGDLFSLESLPVRHRNLRLRSVERSFGFLTDVVNPHTWKTCGMPFRVSACDPLVSLGVS